MDLQVTPCRTDSARTEFACPSGLGQGILNQGSWTVRHVFQGWPSELRNFETQRRNELLTPSWLFLSISSSTSFSNQSCHRYSTLWYHPRLQITPQLYQQFPTQSHNPDPPNPAAPMTKALFIPLRQLALWLIPQPPPPFVPRDAEKNTQHFQPATRRCETAGDLDHHRPEVAITRLTLPLFSGHLSALMRVCGQSRQCPHFFAVPELPPTEACPGRTVQGTPAHIARRCTTQSLSTLITFLRKTSRLLYTLSNTDITSP